jgi:ubiquinone/menaquinone biosynthesis C-methylase UbiE
MTDFAEFGRQERLGWSDAGRAEGYVSYFSSAADQVGESLLDIVELPAGASVLDLCCGQGRLTALLAERGFRTSGLDFSPAMLERAQRAAPAARFHEGDAQELPFEDGAVDAVACNFGVCHLPEPSRCLSEVRRVLKPGGTFAMTNWCGPDLSPPFRIFYGAVQAHGSPEATIPPGPDFHQLTRDEVVQDLLSKAGFSDIALRILKAEWTLESPEGLADIYERGTVRATMLLSRQPAANLKAIRDAISAAVEEEFAVEGGWRVPIFAGLVTARA